MTSMTSGRHSHLAINCCTRRSSRATASRVVAASRARRERARPSPARRGRRARPDRTSRARAARPRDRAPRTDGGPRAFVPSAIVIVELPAPAPDLARRARRVGMHDTVLELHAVSRLLGRRVAVAEHRRDVRALDLVARMRQPVRGGAVGREQQHAFGQVVEPADVREPGTSSARGRTRSCALPDRTAW